MFLKKNLLVFNAFIYCFFIGLTASQAQGRDDFWVAANSDPWAIAHRSTRGETVIMLSRRYHVPPAILADGNNVGYNEALKENTTLMIPLGAYNLQSEKPANFGESKALYYRVQKEDNLARISKHAGISQKTLAIWNNMDAREVRPGQILLVGWILYDMTVINNVPVSPPNGTVKNNTPILQKSPVMPPLTKQKDTPKYVITELPPIDTSSFQQAPAGSLEAQFQEQTQNGENLVTEKGSASFYKLMTQAKGAASLAFHNKAAKGTIIKVKNINNGRYVYVKVLGPVPLTKQYYNCIIGLSSKVQAVLGVKDVKAFCELSYAGY